VPHEEQNRAFGETVLPQDEQNMERRFYQPNWRKTTPRSRLEEAYFAGRFWRSPLIRWRRFIGS
jgi:hypothetical protein